MATAKHIGLVCCPEKAKPYAEKLSKIGYRIVALWTPVLEVTIQLAATQDIPFAAQRPDEVVLRKEVEMVVVDCRPNLKSHIVLSALGIGKHVVCSAPMSLTVKDASSLIEASNYYPQLHAVVAYGSQFCALYRKMRDLIREGSLGSRLFCEVNVKCRPIINKNQYDWTWDKESGGGLLNVVGSCVIDMLRFIFDCNFTRIHGTVGCLERKSTSRLKSPNDSSVDASDNDPLFAHRSPFNSDDFCSFIMKCQRVNNHNNEGCCFEVNVNVVINSSAYALAPNGEAFSQEINIFGPGGTLSAKNASLHRRHSGTKGGDQSVQVELPLVLAQSQIIDLHGLDSVVTACRNLDTELLSSNDASTPTGERMVNNFVDDLYVRLTIEAIKRSSLSGNWVAVDKQN